MTGLFWVDVYHKLDCGLERGLINYQAFSCYIACHGVLQCFLRSDAVLNI